MRQLIKYCLVGASSTVIDIGVYWILSQILPPTIPWYVLKSISFCFGVTNGFFWNRHWTFKARDLGTSRQQYPKFVATNLVGLGLNLGVTKVFLFFFTGQWIFAVKPRDELVILASLCAVPIVVIWNFTASRLWTFRPPKSSGESNLRVPPITSPD
jgi:putative flippase GtrA